MMTGLGTGSPTEGKKLVQNVIKEAGLTGYAAKTSAEGLSGENFREDMMTAPIYAEIPKGVYDSTDYSEVEEKKVKPIDPKKLSHLRY